MRPRTLLAALLALPTTLAAQATHRVGPGFHPDIQSAVDAAAPGDIVEIAAGVYPSFGVGKPLTIVNEPSALVQVVTTGAVTFTLQPQDRVVLAGLDIQAHTLTIDGGVVSSERLTVRTDVGLVMSHCTLTMRWCAAGATLGSGVLLIDAHLHASDSSFSTAAGGLGDIELGAVRVVGNSACCLSSCSLIGAWPAAGGHAWPSAALHVTDALGSQRTWLVDCTLTGGFLFTGMQGPAVAAPALPAIAPVRFHRCQFAGPVFGAVAFGRVIGTTTPVDMTIGSTFVMTARSEPGTPLLFYTGIDALGPVQIWELEQPAFLFIDTFLFPIVVANAQGIGTLPFPIPNQPNLRNISLWWRCLDLSAPLLQGTPPFITVVQ